jgi:hypothetical protein
MGSTNQYMLITLATFQRDRILEQANPTNIGFINFSFGKIPHVFPIAVTTNGHGSRPAIVVVSYAGNDIFGTHGFIHCDWLNQEMACYSQRRREAANAMLEERVNTHFSALNDLVKLSTRPDIGNIVLVMPLFGRGYGLHPVKPWMC